MFGAHLVSTAPSLNPPYPFIDQNGKPTDYNVEPTQPVAQVTQLDIEIRIGPWARRVACAMEAWP